MNDRQRFLGTMMFKDVDRVPDYEFGYWAETMDRWHMEGLPQDQRNNRDIELYFDLEGWDCHETLPIRTGLWPTLPSRILEQTPRRTLIDDGMGGICESLSTSTPPRYLRYPLKNHGDWEKLKPFFNPDTPGRFPLNWDEVADGFKERGYTLSIGIGSLYGWLRNWMGFENLSVAFYKQPDWVAEMMDTLTNLWMKIVEKALHRVQVDCSTWWEDMCYSHGPLISPRHFMEFMVPRYRKVTSLLKEHGVNVNIVDCDGRIDALVPGWLEAGINCMFPVEARHTDIYRLREKYGRKVLLMGGVNKLALMKGQATVDEELKRLTPLLEQGGYIPTVDHRVPPEVSLANYKYYLKQKRKWIGRGN